MDGKMDDKIIFDAVDALVSKWGFITPLGEKELVVGTGTMGTTRFTVVQDKYFIQSGWRCLTNAKGTTFAEPIQNFEWAVQVIAEASMYLASYDFCEKKEKSIKILKAITKALQ